MDLVQSEGVLRLVLVVLFVFYRICYLMDKAFSISIPTVNAPIGVPEVGSVIVRLICD